MHDFFRFANSESRLEKLAKRYNVAPTTSVPAIRDDDDGKRALFLDRWGLIPIWAKPDARLSLMTNARSETGARIPEKYCACFPSVYTRGRWSNIARHVMKLRPALVLGLLISQAAWTFGQTPASAPLIPAVEIRGVRETKYQDWVAADNVWRINWPCLKVDLWTTGDLKAYGAIGKAYFFDSDKRIVSQFGSIPAANHPDGSYGLPPLMRAHTNIDVYVPIDSKTKTAKWRFVVLVFGAPEKLTAEVYPKREGISWKDFDFAERAKLSEQGASSDFAKTNQSSLVPPASSLPPLVSPGSSKAAREIKIRATVPGADLFKFRDGTMWVEHVSRDATALPHDVMVNGVAWEPTWNDRTSSQFNGFNPPPAPFANARVVVTQISGRTPIENEPPSAANGYTLTVKVTDSPAGEGEYVFQIKW